MQERSVLAAIEEEFRKNKSLGERAMAQVDEDGLHHRLSERQNSITVIVQHLAGNMMSRFTDFLTGDGEKPSRNREAEFVDRMLAREELMGVWEKGWKCLFAALEPLTDVDLQKTVTIRGEPHTVVRALVRQVGHYGWHAGQIALIAKHVRGEAWQYLTIRPGGTEEFNRKMGL